MVQTRGVARSALRSAFIQHQTQRHQAQSVVRATASFLSSPVETPPPPVPRPRTDSGSASKPANEEPGLILASIRATFHRKNKARRHHVPGYQGRARNMSELNSATPDLESIEDDCREKEKVLHAQRKKQIELGVPRTPEQWLHRRLERTENPRDDFQESKRDQLRLDKKEWFADGTNLNTPGPSRYRPWNDSSLSLEIGWEWKGESSYQYSKDA